MLLEYKTIDDIIHTSLDELSEFLIKASHNRFVDANMMAEKLKSAASNSYRLDKLAYDPINLCLASSINLISYYENELREINKVIQRQMVGFSQNQYQSLLSIPGISKVYAAGILAEIADIHQFESDDALAKYAGITWRRHQSGKFESDETSMTKTGNKCLRYFIMEAANITRIHNQEFKDYYQKKYNEVTTHQHKRTLALTSRKLIRLIFGLLSSNRLFQ